MKYALLCSILISYLFGFSQTQIWTDDFETSATDWDLSIQSGTNEVNSNIWNINDNEGGVIPPGCAVKSNGVKTLHVTCQGILCGSIGTGAVYYPGDMGLGGMPGTTNIRAALIAPISTTGETQLELDFDWMGVGVANVAFAELEYSTDGGATWNVLWSQTPAELCPSGEDKWTSQTVTLPVAAENQADLRFAFNWKNDNNPTGQFSSFAVNNLVLTSNSVPTGDPIAAFTATSFTICENDCIDFTDASTGTNVSAWDWSFGGANTSTSNNQNPSNICWSTAGTYNVRLTVTDDSGSDDVTHQVKVKNCGSNPPTAAFSTENIVICAGDCIDFSDESTNDPITWDWDFDGAKPTFSTSQNPTNICFETPGSYAIKLTVSNSTGTDQIITPITVLELPTIQAFGDTTIDIGGAAELNSLPSQPGFIFWLPVDDLNCDTCANVIASPLITTTYYPSVTDLNGCTGNDTVTVFVVFEEIVDVPSAFSPNGDGQNDLLRVLGIGIVEIDFKIYNRYGQLVFSSTDIEEGWDGTMNGKLLNQGVFVYTLNYTLVDGTTSEKTGNITLVK